jgi:hypothetical protein
VIGVSFVLVATTWLQTDGQQSPPWYTWAVVAALVSGLLALGGAIYAAQLNRRTQKEVSQQRQDFDREMKELERKYEEEQKEFERKYEEEQANKAVIRKVLKACNRKAVMTRMRMQLRYGAMFKGIQECRESVQQILPEIRVEDQQQIVADVREELMFIEAREANFYENISENFKEIDRAKRSIIRHLMELSNNAGVPYTLPRNVTEEWFKDAEGANAPSEGPEIRDTGRLSPPQ